MDMLCMAQPDLLVVAEAFKYLNVIDTSGQAAAFLYHYMAGQGAEVQLNLRNFLADEPRILEKVKAHVRAAQKEKIDIQQKDFRTAKWKNSTGSVYIYWKEVNGKIQLRLQDEYHWHSDQKLRDIRTTECVHQAMDRLKRAGAKNYPITSSIYIIDKP